MALEISVSIIKRLPVVSGQGKNGEWSKQEFIGETLEKEYPKKVCFTAWGEKVKDLDNFPDGEVVKLTFSAESREYNERWYTELRAFRIESGGPAIPQSSQPVQSAPARSSQPAPASTQMNQQFFDGDESNDLPF